MTAWHEGPPGTVGGLLARRAAQDPHSPFVKCGGDWLSAQTMMDSASAVAAGLTALGLSKGDRIATLLPNRQEALELFFTCAQLGLILVPLNAFLKGDFLGYQLRDCQANALVVDGLGLLAAESLLADTSIKHVIVVDDISPATRVATVRYHDIQVVSATECVDGPTPQDLMAILYTSGTTGPPKGCMLPHSAYLASAKTYVELDWFSAADRIFTACPLFHSGTQIMALMSALVAGGSACFETEFSASRFVSRIRDERATAVISVGAMAAALLAQPPSKDDTRHEVRLALWTPLSADRQLEIERRFAMPSISEVYGQTEAHPLTLSRWGGQRNRDSAGQPAPHYEIKLVDDTGGEVRSGSVGEILVRPRAEGVMFSGYWQKGDATTSTGPNRWHRTGDFATMDEHGFVTFVDRKKDALRRRGENVSSRQLEEAIRAYPAVSDVAVVAVPSVLGEDDIKACLVCDPGSIPTPDDLFEFFTSVLPYFCMPRYVEVLDALPVNAVGRVLKHVLRDQGVTPTTWDFEKLDLVVDRAQRR